MEPVRWKLQLVNDALSKSATVKKRENIIFNFAHTRPSFLKVIFITLMADTVAFTFSIK